MYLLAILDLAATIVYTFFKNAREMPRLNYRFLEDHMPVNLKGRSFLTLRDFSPEEIRYLLDLSRDLKGEKTRRHQGERFVPQKYRSHFR